MLKAFSAVANAIRTAVGGLLQIAGPTAGTTRTMTVPDANFTAARTDAANSFTGDQTLATGNLIQGTAAKGINFSANSGLAGKTSTLMNWYEEGTFTPTFGNLTIVGDATYTGRYTRIGRQVSFVLRVQSTTSTAATLGLTFFNLPFGAAFTSTLTAVQSSAGASYGTGLVATDGNGYAPTWAANADVTICGVYFV